MLSLSSIALLITTVLAVPSARIKDGLIMGSTTNTVDSFLGVPFADPPVGNLRLRRPQRLSKSLGTFNATTIPRACPQKALTGELPILKTLPTEVAYIYTSYNTTIPVTGEDCLTLDIRRPANVSADAKLPVLFWIYGGAFEDGATVINDQSVVVARSVEVGEPIIVVSVNYRLNTFGFLGGKELKAEGNTNLGLRDQRLALEWVQENIKAFGGNPDKVTLWGQSAGSLSVYHHQLINDGNHTSECTGKPLFHGAIMQSGAAFPAEPIDSSVAQATYNRIVSDVGCATAKSTVQCLRDAPYEKLLDATNKLPYLYSPAGFHINFVPRPDNSDDFFTISEFAPGHGIVDVPLIVGHQEDEATTFMVPTSDISTRAALGSMLQDNFPYTPRSVIDKLVSYYRGDFETGAPFRTNASQNAYPNSKVVSAVVTDVTFFFHIRNFLQSLVGPSAIVYRTSPVWAFQGAYLHGFPFIGTFHGSDLALLGGAFPNLESVKNEILGRYIRFVRTGIPQVTAAGNLEWPTYGAKKELLQFNADGEKIIKDDFRQKAFEYFETAKGFFRF